ncbi:MAG: nucleotidyltransferase family protein [Euryarchaeota archaeon]|nr:nucleotidyltransferase family protein [Euryarchaeota archaeon]
MKALVLAGGFARRLAPLTDYVAKPLLPLGEKLVIDWVMERVREIGIKDIAISTNKYYEKQFRYWANCKNYDINLIIEPTRGEEEKFGAIAGIKYAIDTLGQDEYLIIGGDNVFDFSLKPLIELYRKKHAPTMAVYDVGSYEKAKRYGVVKIDSQNRVIKMQEKPDAPESTLISTATYVFPKTIYTLLNDYLSEKNNPDSPGYFLAWLSTRVAVYAQPYTGLWKDIGNIEEYRELFLKYI